MKTIEYIKLFSLSLLLLLFSCSGEEKGELYKAGNYRLTITDYQTFTPDSFPTLNGFFTPKHPANKYLPAWLNKRYHAVGVGSTAEVSYQYRDFDRSEQLDLLKLGLYQLDYADYQLAWGDVYADFYTPKTNPSSSIVELLNTKVIQDQSYFVTYYRMSEKEAVIKKDEERELYALDYSFLDKFPVGKWGLPLDETEELSNYFIKNVGTNGRNWSGFTYTPKGICVYHDGMLGGDAWFITPEIDLQTALNPYFEFGYGHGYPKNTSFFSVLISENFNGEDPLLSKWVDITDQLRTENGGDISTVKPSRGYPQSLHMLKAQIEQYAGKKIHIAIRSHLPTTAEGQAASFYLINFLQVKEKRDIAFVDHVKNEYQLFMIDEGRWKPAPPVFYVLQDKDYADLNVTHLGLLEASTKIPVLMDKLFVTDPVGTKRIIVFKVNSSEVNASEFITGDEGWKESGGDIVTATDLYEFGKDMNWNFIKNIEN